MKLGKLSYVLIATLLLNQIPINSASAAASPEEQCFDLLTEAAKSNPAFSKLDLSKVRKTNGKKNDIKSGKFSVATYEDFMDTFNTPVPYFSDDIPNYPNKMDKVPTQYKFIPSIHKANRNNTASIIYNNGIRTKIDHWMSKDGSSTGTDIQNYFAGKKSASALDAKHYRQTIDGYYLDSRYVSFGAESELDFSYPTRAAAPSNDDYYPTGRPVKDMRQYLIYTHHLSPALGGDLLSCEIIKMVPQSPYKLKDFDHKGLSLDWVNYGGTKMSQSDAKTDVIGKNGKFRKAEIDYTTSVKGEPDKKLFRFYTLSINYDNGNSFLNTFITSELFNEAMRDAKNASQTFLEMRRAFYNKVIASGLEIGSGSTASVQNQEIVQGSWCGLKLSTTTLIDCQGQDPATSCPSGYQKRQWATLGSAPLSSCFKKTTGLGSLTPPESGLWCGIKMTGDTDRTVLCGGYDPKLSCPTGYTSQKLTSMPETGGDWYSCMKDADANAIVLHSGTQCGLKMAHQSTPIQTCEGHNPEISCPDNYTSRQWANLDSSWGEWFSCFKNSTTPTKTVETTHFNAARWNLPDLGMSGKTTYYASDQATANKVCTLRGEQTGEGFSEGEWIGSTDSLDADEWSSSSLAIRGWDNSKGAYSVCTTGSQCVTQKETIRNKIKCVAY